MQQQQPKLIAWWIKFEIYEFMICRLRPLSRHSSVSKG